MTNREFKNADSYFQKCCESIELPVTDRQASKFRNNRGMAFTKGKTLVKKEK